MGRYESKSGYMVGHKEEARGGDKEEGRGSRKERLVTSKEAKEDERLYFLSKFRILAAQLLLFAFLA
eukprot:6212310-Pleurochrysis_carterae.AAC.5